MQSCVKLHVRNSPHPCFVQSRRRSHFRSRSLAAVVPRRHLDPTERTTPPAVAPQIRPRRKLSSVRCSSVSNTPHATTKLGPREQIRSRSPVLSARVATRLSRACARSIRSVCAPGAAPQCRSLFRTSRVSPTALCCSIRSALAAVRVRSRRCSLSIADLRQLLHFSFTGSRLTCVAPSPSTLACRVCIPAIDTRRATALELTSPRPSLRCFSVHSQARSLAAPGFASSPSSPFLTRVGAAAPLLLGSAPAEDCARAAGAQPTAASGSRAVRPDWPSKANCIAPSDFGVDLYNN